MGRLLQYAIWRTRAFTLKIPNIHKKIKVNILPTTKTIGTSYHHSSLSLVVKFVINNNLLKYLIQLMVFLLVHIFKKGPL
jgi:hypothetical protein